MRELLAPGSLVARPALWRRPRAARDRSAARAPARLGPQSSARCGGPSVHPAPSPPAGAVRRRPSSERQRRPMNRRPPDLERDLADLARARRVLGLRPCGPRGACGVPREGSSTARRGIDWKLIWRPARSVGIWPSMRPDPSRPTSLWPPRLRKGRRMGIPAARPPDGGGCCPWRPCCSWHWALPCGCKCALPANAPGSWLRSE